MATINQLSSVDTLQGGDQIPVYDQSNGDARKASMTTLASYMASAIPQGNASNISFTQGETGAVQRTVQAKLEESVSVKDFGAVGDGITDDTAAINLAIASGAPAIYIPAGTYKISSSISVTRDIAIFGDGNATKIDTTNVGALVTAFDFAGAEPTLVEVNASDIIAGQRSYTFSAGHGFEENDLAIIWDDTEFSYSSDRAYYYKGEALVVNSVSGLTVGFYSGAFDAYSATTAALYKASPISVVLKDFDVVGPSGFGAFRAVRIANGRDCVIDNVNIKDGGTYTGIELLRCYDVDIINCTSSITEYAVGYVNMYPIGIFNSQRVRVIGCSARSLWHATSTGGSIGAGSIVNREIIFSNCNLSSQNGAFAGDLHGNTEHSTYVNCTATGSGFTMGGNYNSFINNKIMDVQKTLVGGGEDDYAQSICFYNSEATGYSFIISGNTFETGGSYIANSFGKFLHIVKNDTGTKSGALVISNNQVLLLNETNPYNDFVINVQDVSSTNPTNVDIIIENNSFYNKANPVRTQHNIRITTNNTDASDRFRTVSIRNNIMEKVGIDLDYVNNVIVEGNDIQGAYAGVSIIEFNDLTFRNNNVSRSLGRGLYIANARGDYVIANDNIFVDNYQDAALVGSGAASADVFLSTTTDMPYVRFAGNYIRCNGNAEQALTYNEVYGLQEFNNRIDGSGSVRKVWHAVQDADGASVFVGGESETAKEFWHYGTTQTDFAQITFGNTSSGAVLVRLHIANSIAGYSGVVEFGLEGVSGGTISTVNYSYTSTSDPVAGGRLIINTVGDVVTLSMDDVAAEAGSHVKAEIIKGTRKTLLRSLDVEWLV
jgi:hypothetical protein